VWLGIPSKEEETNGIQKSNWNTVGMNDQKFILNKN
jgi:hypothetical protein